MSSNALAVVESEKPSALPAFTGRDMVAALAAYRDLQRSLDQHMPDQILNLDGKPFRKKGYWRAIGVAFNLTVELVEERREILGPLPNGSDNFAYLITYRAKTPTGRAETGDGACTAAEKSVGRMRATEHNVRSHAHTRAFNRAVSNLVGFGEVSAEEADADDHDPADVAPSHQTPVTEQVTPAAARRTYLPEGVVVITKVDPPWKDAKGPAKAFLFHSGMPSGSNAGFPIYSSSVKTIAEECWHARTPVHLEIVTSTTSGKTYVKNITPVEDGSAPAASGDAPPFDAGGTGGTG